MTRRYIVTTTDDPTLAAEAHAAILAVPGVEEVEDVTGRDELGAGRVVVGADGWCPWWTPFGGPSINLVATSTLHTERADAAGAPPYTVADEDDGAP